MYAVCRREGEGSLAAPYYAPCFLLFDCLAAQRMRLVVVLGKLPAVRTAKVRELPLQKRSVCACACVCVYV